MGLLDGNCYERMCREISSSEAKVSPGRKYKGQGRGFTKSCLHEATRFQQSGLDAGLGNDFNTEDPVGLTSEEDEEEAVQATSEGWECHISG